MVQIPGAKEREEGCESDILSETIPLLFRRGKAVTGVKGRDRNKGERTLLVSLP